MTTIDLDQCQHTNWKHTRRGTGIWKQCTDCFRAVGSAVSKNKFLPGQIDVMPIFDEQARRTIEDQWMHERQSEREQQQQRTKEERRSKYEAYLLSPAWHALRIKVLRRDNYLCQACYEARATDVHHKTYEHLFNEPMFDLESVCRPCHERLHDITPESEP